MCHLGPLLSALGAAPRVSKKDRVARLLIQGLDYQAVAERAGVSVGTVKVYASHLKLGRKHAKLRALAEAERAEALVEASGKIAAHILPASRNASARFAAAPQPARGVPWRRATTSPDPALPEALESAARQPAARKG